MFCNKPPSLLMHYCVLCNMTNCWIIFFLDVCIIQYFKRPFPYSIFFTSMCLGVNWTVNSSSFLCLIKFNFFENPDSGFFRICTRTLTKVIICLKFNYGYILFINVCNPSDWDFDQWTLKLSEKLGTPFQWKWNWWFNQQKVRNSKFNSPKDQMNSTV